MKKEWFKKIGNLYNANGNIADRYYINSNDIFKAIGFSYKTNNSGHINYAELNGEKISHSYANEIWKSVDTSKFYYDTADNSFNSKLSYYGIENKNLLGLGKLETELKKLADENK